MARAGSRVLRHHQLRAGRRRQQPEDALTVARRARSLGFHSTVGIAHDGAGQSHALPERQFSIYQEIRRLETGVFSFAHYDRFQENLVRGLPNAWHCRAGARFLYICEDGLVHWCSQQRGHPGIPLVDYKHEDIERQYAIVKECAPFCGISCVQQTAMLDEIRENPRGMLQQLIERRRATDPNFRTPLLLRFIAWAFLDNPRASTFRRPLSGCSVSIRAKGPPRRAVVPYSGCPTRLAATDFRINVSNTF